MPKPDEKGVHRRCFTVNFAKFLRRQIFKNSAKINPQKIFLNAMVKIEKKSPEMFWNKIEIRKDIWRVVLLVFSQIFEMDLATNFLQNKARWLLLSVTIASYYQQLCYRNFNKKSNKLLYKQSFCFVLTLKVFVVIVFE